MEPVRCKSGLLAAGRNSGGPRRRPSILLTALLALAVTVTVVERARADEGGISFWLPGQFGSLAAAPLTPGWSLASLYVHTSVTGGGEVAASRQATIGRFPVNVSIDLNASLKGRGDFFLVVPTYVFETKVLGGQLAIGMAGGSGHSAASIEGTLTVAIGPIIVTRQGSISDDRWGFTDLFPQASLRWNHGVHNFMTYVLGDIPVGTYDHTRLANLGIGHAAIDGGIGYTYFDPHAGNEFSFVTGLTYNFENPDTDYRNGIDWHLDWGISKFLTKQLHVGAVGYIFQQLTPDRGQPLILGEFKSRVAGIGPQIGYIFPLGNLQGYLNLKGYWEFAAENRPEGWNTWLTFSISPAPHSASPPPMKPRFTK